MNFQIDVKPANKHGMHQVNLYLDGSCYSMLAMPTTVYQLQKARIVKQVRGTKLDDKGQKVEFDYENNTDGAGIQFTSAVFKTMVLTTGN